jgi:hypothetical protein
MQKSPLWLVLSMHLAAGFLAACRSGDLVLHTPTFAVTPTNTHISTEVGTSTQIVPSISPTPEYDEASLAPVAKEILNIFPLAPGAVWTYQVTIDTSTGPDTIDHWDGTITATVTGASLEQGYPLFRLEWLGHPDIASPEIGIRYYVVLDTGIYEEYSQQSALNLIQAEAPAYPPYMTWPLKVGEEWNRPQDYTFPVWFIEAQESVEVPAGRFEDCIKTVIYTNPDHAFQWFCPRAGLVRYEYHHHGSVHDEIWELASFAINSP